ncbi:MAG: peptidoglycan-binding protein [Actinomycetota bacterium]|nr:peptidoglycan-binding protein [Actinomycetota bacterium]
MRLYRLGDQGEPVRDIQGRLAALGYRIEPDAGGRFGDHTHAAVISFQRSRGLACDGLVGTETWRELVEAGYRLGDRLLYHRRPMLRGDDVAELQRRLNALGFEAGKVDGIFGSETLDAVIEFQRNRGMGEDGIVGPEVLEELALMARATRKTGREAVREREWLRSLPASLVGRRVFLDPFCRDAEESSLTWEAAGAAFSRLRERGAVPLLSRSSDTDLAERVRARRANRLGSDLVVGFQLPVNEEPAVFFFASPLSRSDVGARLAAEVADRLGLPTEGRSPVILKETRAPAVLVAASKMGPHTGELAAEGVEAFFLQPR